MSRYQVTRSYIACAVYEVDAYNGIEGTRLARQGEGDVNAYDGDWDEAVAMEQLEE